MSQQYALTKDWWTVHTGSDENAIVYGQRSGATRCSTPHTSFAEFDTEEELATYLGALTGDENWYWDRKPKEEA